MKKLLEEKDLILLSNKNVSVDYVQKQLKRFITGFLPLKTVKSARVGDGILRLTEEEVDHFAVKFDVEKKNLKLIKFTPASGAASRMFKNLFEYQQASDRSKFPKVKAFLEKIDQLPFADQIEEKLKEKGDTLSSVKEDVLLNSLLHNTGLDLPNLPKALIEFHKYGSEKRTPLMEQLIEGIEFAGRGKMNYHFTVSEQHLSIFDEKLQKYGQEFKEREEITPEFELSIQDNKTDTIAVNLDNNPLRSEQGELIFRPGGHGALINNLNSLDGDLIFIKNIDNVCLQEFRPIEVRFKKALGGALIEIKELVSYWIEQIDNGLINASNIDRLELFLNSKLGIQLPTQLLQEKIVSFRSILDRPIRVCGMVVNTGEPGGGPFWVEDKNGTVSLQIVEAAQIDKSSEGYEELMKSASHFNPVDIVCSTKDYQGNQFNLPSFVDEEAGFISTKYLNGNPLKALELPGLWNGGMSNWNTLFVEVPAITFNPVKTVFDLLESNHQSQKAEQQF